MSEQETHLYTCLSSSLLVCGLLKWIQEIVQLGPCTHVENAQQMLPLDRMASSAIYATNGFIGYVYI